MEDLSYIYGTGNIADSLQIFFITDAGNWQPRFMDPKNVFQITKLDTVNRIISGTFSFSLFISPTDSVMVTDGRFDFRIGQYSHCSN